MSSRQLDRINRALFRLGPHCCSLRMKLSLLSCPAWAGGAFQVPEGRLRFRRSFSEIDLNPRKETRSVPSRREIDRLNLFIDLNADDLVAADAGIGFARRARRTDTDTEVKEE
jgi:hypothetical protein